MTLAGLEQSLIPIKGSVRPYSCHENDDAPLGELQEDIPLLVEHGQRPHGNADKIVHLSAILRNTVIRKALIDVLCQKESGEVAEAACPATPPRFGYR